MKIIIVQDYINFMGRRDSMNYISQIFMHH